MSHVDLLTKFCAVLLACFALAATGGCQAESKASAVKREASAAGADNPADPAADSEQTAAADPDQTAVADRSNSDRYDPVAVVEDESGPFDASDEADGETAVPVDDSADEADDQAGDEADDQVGNQADEAAAQPKYAFQSFPVPEHFVRLHPKQDVWVDKKNRTVVMDGEICLREGLLELLLCEEGGKTHESVIKAKAKPSIVRAGLEAIGAKKGKPAEFQPKYKPASGDRIEIRVKYLDPDGKMHEVLAQEFVRNVKTRKVLGHPWVFAGSFFEFNDFEKREVFMADATGDFICVSNFPTAIMDLPIPSSQANEQLMFEAFKENIPLIGTKVRVTLKPKPMKKEGEAAGERS